MEPLNHKEEETPLMLPYIVSESQISFFYLAKFFDCNIKFVSLYFRMTILLQMRDWKLQLNSMRYAVALRCCESFMIYVLFMKYIYLILENFFTQKVVGFIPLFYNLFQ